MQALALRGCFFVLLKLIFKRLLDHPLKKAQKAAEKIKTVTKEVVHVIPLDLASLASVRKFAEEIKALTTKVDILINNAGSKLYRVSQQFLDRDYLKIKRDEKFVKVYLCSS